MSNWKSEAAACIARFNAPKSLEEAQANPMRLAITDLRAAAIAFRARPNLDGFAVRSAQAADDIAAKLERFGNFASDAQAGYARKLCDWSGIYQMQAQEAAPAARHEAITPTPATPVAAPAPVAPAVLFPNLTALVNLDKFARFTVGKLALSLKNDGTLIWVKWDGRIAGVIDSFTGKYRASRKNLSEVALAEVFGNLREVEADPMGAAKAHGILTGRCTCCGRALTDPASIDIGIGPICLAKFG